jgi:antitoxin HicB
MEQVFKLPLILKPQPGGGYTVTCPLISNLITEVDTIDQVQANVSDALAALLELYEDLDEPLPPVLRPHPMRSLAPIWAETLVVVGSS